MGFFSKDIETMDEHHLAETRIHVHRVERVFEMHGVEREDLFGGTLYFRESFQPNSTLSRGQAIQRLVRNQELRL
jgi:hypothetical protein